MFEVKKTLIIDVMKGDQNIRDMFLDRYNSFCNDSYLPLHSELSPTGKEKWGETLNYAAMENWYGDILEEEDYTVDDFPFDAFIREEGLQVEDWLLKQDVNLSDIDEILVKVCW